MSTWPQAICIRRQKRDGEQQLTWQRRLRRHRGWRYSRHGHFHRIMNQAQQLTGSDRLRYLHGRAEILHINYYDLKDELNAETIRNDIEDMAELIDILYPLTGLNSG